jgi:hypothetical protein
MLEKTVTIDLAEEYHKEMKSETTNKIIYTTCLLEQMKGILFLLKCK